MILQRVVYELFEWEAVETSPAALAEREGLRRQVRLEGADGARAFISWAWGRGQPDYFIDHAPDSFFTNLPEVEQDASPDPPWRSLIGRAVTIGHGGAGRPVLEVRTGDTVTYCCSFQMDRVLVLRELRAPA